MRSKLLLVIAVAGSCLALIGCFDKDDPVKNQKAPLPFAGQSVGIAAPAGLGFRSTWEGPLIEWQAQNGAKVELTEYDPAEASQPAAQFSADTEKSLLVFPLEKLGDLLDTGALAPIPESTLKDPDGLNWIDLHAGLRDGLGSPRKRPSIVPLSCPVLLCWYRQDLLSKAGLSAPRTWDEYGKLLETLGTWAPGLTAVEPWGPEFRSTMFLARSLAWAKHPGHFSLFFDIDSGSPLIDGPGFVRALEVSQQAWPKLAADFKNLSPADCRRRILNGEVALAITFIAPAAGEALQESAAAGEANRRPESARIGICRLPGSRETYNPTRKTWEPVADQGVNQVTLCGFAGLGVAASGRRKPFEIEAAWNAVTKIGSQGFVSGFPSGTIGQVRESQTFGLAGESLNGEEATAYSEAVAASLRDGRQVIELPVVRRREFLGALGTALTSVLDEGTAPADGLKTAAKSWQALVDEIGPARLRNGYRAALGLSPIGDRR